MRLIDADALCEALGVGKECTDCRWAVGAAFCHRGSDFVDACEAITDAPTIDIPTAQPQRKGRWVRKESDMSWWYECSECGESPLFDPYENEVRTPFCPWCGAEMRGEDDEVD